MYSSHILFYSTGHIFSSLFPAVFHSIAVVLNTNEKIPLSTSGRHFKAICSSTKYPICIFVGNLWIKFPITLRVFWVLSIMAYHDHSHRLWFILYINRKTHPHYKYRPQNMFYQVSSRYQSLSYSLWHSEKEAEIISKKKFLPLTACVISTF